MNYMKQENYMIRSKYNELLQQYMYLQTNIYDMNQKVYETENKLEETHRNLSDTKTVMNEIQDKLDEKTGQCENYKKTVFLLQTKNVGLSKVIINKNKQ